MESIKRYPYSLYITARSKQAKRYYQMHDFELTSREAFLHDAEIKRNVDLELRYLNKIEV